MINKKSPGGSIFPYYYKNGELFGYKRVRNLFEEVAEKNPENIINQLKNDESAWIKNADPDDDVTFVVIKVK